MLVFARNDGEAIIFFDGISMTTVCVECQERVFRLRDLTSGKIILKLESVQDRKNVEILGFTVNICLRKFRSDESVAIGFTADRELLIIREEFSKI